MLTRLTIILLLITASGLGRAADLPYVNWENHPVHALDISPDGNTLAAAHTADNRVQLFDISQGIAVPRGHVAVGVDPVSVRFRTNNELWVVNHISDSINIIDVSSRLITAVLSTQDEPFDVIFAGQPQRAFVSCSQADSVMVFDPDDLTAAAVTVPIEAEDPRGLAVNSDGSLVFAAIFESGNRSTILTGGRDPDDGALQFPPITISDPSGPYQGQNPPPNSGPSFFPAVNPDLPEPPPVSLIVRQNASGQWLDDNQADWTEFVSGQQAGRSGRIPGWELLDRDIAVIDTQSLGVEYIDSLMNIGMAIAYNPAREQVTLVGTDASNEIRFEPNLNGRFLQVLMASSDAARQQQPQIVDLNPHLDYSQPRLPAGQRIRSVGDPRAVVWQRDGERAYVAAMGSNNVLVLNSQGRRIGGIAPLRVGEGPAGLALDETRDRLYVWNHFEASLSVINLLTLQLMDTVAVFNPLPESIIKGRPFLYNTQLTSGNGHVSCASCHVDGRIDRLSWDLGDPAGEMKAFRQNCVTTVLIDPCEDYHPMKGPMTTQTLQDIIGKEPFHWRGDRDGIEEFNPAFVGLLGDDSQLTAARMQRFEDFLATITFPPNPFRNLDNSLPENIDLEGHYTSGRFAPAGLPLGSGSPIRGLQLYTQELLDSPFTCASCHTLPTGLAVNGPLFLGVLSAPVGGSIMDLGPLGENHLGIVSVDGSAQKSIKVPHLRNMYDKVGFEMSIPQSRAGFGFLHDGSVDSLSRFLSARAFDVNSDQEVADLVAFMLAFTGSELIQENPILSTEPPLSKDSHTAVGSQVWVHQPAAPDKLQTLLSLARDEKIDLLVKSAEDGDPRGWHYNPVSRQMHSDRGDAGVEVDQLLNLASTTAPQTWTAVPAGLGQRLGSDRDMDGVPDGVEIAQWSDPADPASSRMNPRIGHWYNPLRSGHGMDIQRLGDRLFIIWFTYNDDGSSTWYFGSEVYSENWSADMYRFTWDPETNSSRSEIIGSMSLKLSDPEHGDFSWEFGNNSGSEPIQFLAFGGSNTLIDYTGQFYDPNEPGWGFSVYSQGGIRVGVVFFYDDNNQPRWAFGQDLNTASGNIPLFTYQGFCPGCEWKPIEGSAAGDLILEFTDSRNAQIDLNLRYPESINSWVRQRGVTAISDPQINPRTR